MRPQTAVARAAMVLIIALSSAACSVPFSNASMDPPMTPAPIVKGLAIIDTDSGTITYPSEKYFATSAEHQRILNARTLAYGTCAADLGVEYHYKPVIPELSDDREFGVWVPEYAGRFGYAPPASPEKIASMNGESTPDFGETTTEQQAQMENECVPSPKVTRFTEISQVGPWTEPLSQALSAVQNSDRAKELRDEWRACLEDRGVTYDFKAEFDAIRDTSWLTDSTQESINVALADTTCKAETGMVQELADMRAAYEAPILKEYEAELQEMRTSYERQLADAGAYLASQGY